MSDEYEYAAIIMSLIGIIVWGNLALRSESLLLSGVSTAPILGCLGVFFKHVINLML